MISRIFAVLKSGDMHEYRRNDGRPKVPYQMMLIRLDTSPYDGHLPVSDEARKVQCSSLISFSLLHVILAFFLVSIC